MKYKTYARIAALKHYGLGTSRVKVIFRNISDTTDEKAYWMDDKTYDRFPLGRQTFIEEYKSFGEVVDAKNTDIYDIEL